MYQKTTAVQKIQSLTKRVKIIQGGTSAGKTIAILLYLIDKAQSQKKSISTVSESYPHLKRGAMRDFFNILLEHGYYRDLLHNKTDSIYNFETGSFMEFFGADQPDKVRGPRRDILFINEANNVLYGVYDQLEVRTKDEVIIDYNPTNEFWVHEHVMPYVDYDFLKLTYKDNEALDEAIVQSIESRKHNENWWRVYGLGELGNKEGQVYDDWEQIETIPDEARLVRHVLDFGYTNDPSAIVDIYQWNSGFIVDEQLYATSQKNKPLANKLRELEGLDPVQEDGKYVGSTKILTIADSAEPKSIDEIKSFGVNIMGAIKGSDSVDFGIQVVQDQKMYVTKRSTNIIKEVRNYLWKVDKRTGNNLNIPIDDFNHSLDAIRYGIVDIVNPQGKKITLHF